MRGIDAGRVADGHEPAAPAQRTQRRLGQVAADGIDDDVGAAGNRPRSSRPRRSPARWSIALVAPKARAAVELLRRRRHRGHRRAEEGAELHGGEADAAAGAEHDQLLARLQPRPPTAARGRRCGGRRRTRRGRGVDAVGDRSERRPRRPPPPRRTRRPVRAAEHAVADRRATSTSVGDLDDLAGELAAGHERRRHRDLVLAGDEQHVGEVHRGGVRRAPAPARAERRRRRRPRPRRRRAAPRTGTPRRARSVGPRHTGGRFSTNAVAPSLASSLANTVRLQLLAAARSTAPRSRRGEPHQLLRRRHAERAVGGDALGAARARSAARRSAARPR